MSKNNFKIDDETFINVIATSRSIRQAILKLGLNGTGNAYKVFKRRIILLNIDISHFPDPKTYLRPRTNFNKIPLHDILILNSTYTSSYHLKVRLIKEQILPDKCAICNIIEWHGKKLSLHLDHLNGVHNDNRIENLRLLCPNCHSMTATYAGRNKKKR